MTKPPKIPESVLVVIHAAALDVLIIKRADLPGFWQSVTGAKDWLDEPLAATAVREETGIVVGGEGVPPGALHDWRHQIEYSIYPQYRHRYAPGITRNTEHWFSLEVPAGIAVTLSNSEAILQLPARLAARGT